MELNGGLLDSLGDGAIDEIDNSWCRFRDCVESLLLSGRHEMELGVHSELDSIVGTLCRHGLVLLVRDHFLLALEDSFKKNTIPQFWSLFDAYRDNDVFDAHKLREDWPRNILEKALQQMCRDRAYQEKCLMLLVCSLQCYIASNSAVHLSVIGATDLFTLYKLRVSAILSMTLPLHFPEILRCYFRKNLESLSRQMEGEQYEGNSNQSHGHSKNDVTPIHSCGNKMDIDGHDQRVILSRNHVLASNVGKNVHDLRSLGFTSVTEDAYAFAIFSLLKERVHSFAEDDYQSSVLASTKEWIWTVPLQFLDALFSYLGDSNDDSESELNSPLASMPSCLQGIISPSEALVRWHLRLEYFAYETLQDLRIAKLFEIIVDFPDSSPAIDDLRQCLDYTGQHSKLVDSFISAVQYRLLTAGASTNDILNQYVSTIKALRAIDPTGVFLELVGEPIREYLKRRKDTIKCIVTMLTDGTGGNTSETGDVTDSLLEELNKENENQNQLDLEEDVIADDTQAWLNAQSWDPDPVEADPIKGGSRRQKLNLLEMIISLIGSKDELVNEYHVMLAEKLLNKSDYDIDSEIRTIELLKINFGESSLQKCEVMLNDLINSKRINSNIKASMPHSSSMGARQGEFNTLDILDATIISSNFWPSVQSESFTMPAAMDCLLSDYAKRYGEIKAPRKLSWFKNLGIVKLELQLTSGTMLFSVAPVMAAIIMKFQEQTCWTLTDLAAAMGLSADSVLKKMAFWTSKGIVAESPGTEPDCPVYTVVEDINGNGSNDIFIENHEEPLSADEEEENPMASIDEQLRNDMTVYENFIIGMLTAFGSMALGRIHNTLKMFCTSDLKYDKSLPQLQSFLSELIELEKIEMRDGSYFLKK